MISGLPLVPPLLGLDRWLADYQGIERTVDISGVRVKILANFLL